jgi:hypothetical protein
MTSREARACALSFFDSDQYMYVHTSCVFGRRGIGASAMAERRKPRTRFLSPTLHPFRLPLYVTHLYSTSL